MFSDIRKKFYSSLGGRVPVGGMERSGGIVGMEGDGPIVGSPKEAGVIVMGRNCPAVDATSARIMGINPRNEPYLASASGKNGTIGEDRIQQRGETFASVKTDFELLDMIPAQRMLRSY